MTAAATPVNLVYSDLAEDPDLAELVELFVREMPSRVTNLQARFDKADWQELERAAHQIKGAAGSYGFHALTPAATRLEVIVRKRSPEDEIRQALDDLTALCRAVRAGVPS
jgi:HPt (histidine-containing phosphotransfer) domain-containing protein